MQYFYFFIYYVGKERTNNQNELSIKTGNPAKKMYSFILTLEGKKF